MLFVPFVELVFAQLNATADGVSYCLQHLVMTAPAPPLSQGFRAAAVYHLFQHDTTLYRFFGQLYDIC